MPGISSTLRLNDGMSAPLRRVNSALMTVLNSFEAMQRVSGQAINTTNISQAREQLIAANSELDKIAQENEKINNQQQRYNSFLAASNGHASGLLSKIKGIAAGYLGLRGLGQLVNLSDTMASNEARLSLIVDDHNSVDTLKAKIFSSAQAARGSYTDTMATVAKLGLQAGEAFSNNNDQMIRFTELMNKQFAVGGASATEQASAMYQLTQAMGSGRLQGDEYRSIIENAPLLANSIKDYMINVKGAQGSMKDWASEGLLTASVIKNALFSSADEVEARFNAMPMTWAQVWTGIKNTAVQALQPVLARLSEIANSEKFKIFVAGFTDLFQKVAGAILWVLDASMAVFNFIKKNWSMIAPIVGGVVAAMLTWKVITTVMSVVLGIKAAVQAMATGATFAETAAQWGLNAALLACPITWIILAIVALIAVIIVMVIQIKKWIDSVGGISVAWLIVKDIIVSAWDAIKIAVMTGVNWVMSLVDKMRLGMLRAGTAIANWVGDLKVNVLTVLQNMINGAIDLINFFINTLNKIPGVNIGVIEHVTFATEAAAKNEADKQARNNALAAAEATVAEREAGRAALVDQMKTDAAQSHAERQAEIASKRAEAAANSSAEETAANTSDISGDTEDISGAVSSSKEDLAYLRDIAEQEAINRFTTAEVKLDFTGMTNRIDSSMDIDGMISEFTEKFSEALSIAAEGDHA